MKTFNDLLQLSLPLISEIPRPRFLDDALIANLDDYSDAVRLCINSRLRRMSEAEIANCLGFSAPHLAKVKAGRGYLTTDQALVLQHLCSNWAIRQYDESRRQQLAEMTETPSEKLARLEAEVAELKRRRAA